MANSTEHLTDLLAALPSINSSQATTFMAPVDFLPPETIERILRTVMREDKVGALRLLLAASLTCKRWSDEARRLLWREIRLDWYRQKDRFLSSPGLGKYNTVKLSIDGGGLLTQKGMSELVSKVRGVEELVLVNGGIKELSYDLFNDQNLDSLKILRIDSVSLTGDRYTKTTVCLKELYLHSLNNISVWFNRPFSVFASPTLTHLSLSDLELLRKNHRDWLLLFTTVGAKLQSLSLGVYARPYPTGSIMAGLALCENLEEIQIRCPSFAVKPFLDSLGSQPRTVILSPTYGTVIGEFEGFVRDLWDICEMRSFERIKVLEFPQIGRASLDTTFVEVIEEMTGKDCTVRFNDDIDWSTRCYTSMNRDKT